MELNYYLSRLWDVAPWPVSLALAAAISLMPVTRLPGWIRADLSAVYLPPSLLLAGVWGMNFAPVALAANITAAVLVCFGMGFSVFRLRQKHCQLSGALFGFAFLVVAITVAFNLRRHYLMHFAQ